MYCPQCGQQQASESLRFCSRCGFPVEGVLQLLANNGILPAYPLAPADPSPRKKGVRQGGVLLLLGILIVPMLGILASFAPGRIEVVFELLAALSSIIFFVGGLMRMLYAALFEEGAPRGPRFSVPSYMAPGISPTLSPPRLGAGLPPKHGATASNWVGAKVNTGELLHRPSVTEGTTRLLNDTPDSEPR
jgi:hypothetical protein